MEASRAGVAVIVFTDLVGSTELRTRLGEDAADDLRRTHDRVFTEAIERHDGQVVKGLGDGLMAVFGGASDGVSAAIAAQQAAYSVELEIRVGLSAGDVVWEEGDCFGTPVVEAARLCGVAQGGQILCADLVLGLAHGRGGHEARSVGELELKGLAAPVPASEVTWTPAGVGLRDLPPALDTTGDIEFVGRVDELKALRGAWEYAEVGDRRTVFVEGLPGTGKTRLVAELAADVHAEGGLVLFGRADNESGGAYQPFVEALRADLEHLDDATAASRAGAFGPELVRLLPELAAHLDTDIAPSPNAERHRLFDGVVNWIAQASTQAPILFVVDDLHRASTPTIQLLRHLVHSPLTMRVLVVTAHRADDASAELTELLTDLVSDRSVERMELAGLADDAAGELATAATDGSGGLSAGQIQQADGNPLLVIELARAVAASPEGRLDHIPRTIADAMAARLRAVSEPAVEVLQIAAVIGRDFDLGTLIGVSERTSDALLEALEEAEEAKLVEPTTGSGLRFQFTQGMVRTSLSAKLPTTRRLRLHVKIADALEAAAGDDLSAVAVALARHRTEAAALGAADAAVDAWLVAVEAAHGELGHELAAKYAERALDVHDEHGAEDARRSDEIRIVLGSAMRRAGDGAHREVLLETARSARDRGDVGQLVAAVLANNRGTFSSALQVDEERVELIRAAVDALGDDDSAERAKVLAVYAVELAWSPDEKLREALCGQALEMARSLGDDEALAHVLNLRPFTRFGPDTVHERLELSAELIDLGMRLGDDEVMLSGWSNRFGPAIEVGDLAEADRALENERELMERLGEGRHAFLAALHEVSRLHVAGRLIDAEAAIDEGFEHGRRSEQPDAEGIAAGQRWLIRREQHRFRDMVDVDNPADDQDPAALALVLAEVGRLEEAKAAYESIPDDAYVDAMHDPGWLIRMCARADLTATVGDPRRAAELLDVLSPFREHIPSPGPICAEAVAFYTGRLLGVLGRTPDACSDLELAREIHTRIAAPIWLARTLLELAELVADDDPQRARDLANEVLATELDPTAAPPLRARAESVLQR